MATIAVPSENCSPLPVVAPSRYFRRPGLTPLGVFFFLLAEESLAGVLIASQSLLECD